MVLNHSVPAKLSLSRMYAKFDAGGTHGPGVILKAAQNASVSPLHSQTARFCPKTDLYTAV